MTERSVDLVPGLIRGHKRDGRCIYDRKAKRELVRRCLQPGVSVAGLALAHGINANLLRKWIVMAGGGRIAEPDSAAVLLPVRTSHPAPIEHKAPAGYLEIVLAGGTLRIFGQVEAQALRVAIDCLAQRT